MHVMAVKQPSKRTISGATSTKRTLFEYNNPKRTLGCFMLNPTAPYSVKPHHKRGPSKQPNEHPPRVAAESKQRTLEGDDDDDVINGGGDGDVWGWSMAVVVSRLRCAGD
ncbi:hypothetical protein Tco_0452686 [Tanacetum coccineum]